MKKEVYSWRLSTEVKSDLEREARLRKTSVSSVLDQAVRDWLGKSQPTASEEEAQRRLHAAAEKCLGAFAGRDSRRSEAVREVVRRRVGRRYGR